MNSDPIGNIEDVDIVMQEAIRMLGNLKMSKELVIEDKERSLGAKNAIIGGAAMTVTNAILMGGNPQSPLFQSLARAVEVGMLVGARTAQRLNGQEVLN